MMTSDQFNHPSKERHLAVLLRLACRSFDRCDKNKALTFHNRYWSLLLNGEYHAI